MENFRDLGYLGIKKGMLLRGGSLYRVYQRDIDMLKKDHNLKVVVDLRSNAEVLKRKDRDIPNVKHLHIPLLPEKDGVPLQDPIINVKGLDLPDIINSYRLLVARDRKESWTKIFELLLKNNEDGIYYHCSAGKDRTGLVTAIILTVLGYDKKTIYEDYLLTNKNKLHHRKFAKQIPDKKLQKVFIHYFEANKEYLDASFDEIDKVYGSMDNFLKECCSLDAEKIKFLKQKYLA